MGERGGHSSTACLGRTEPARASSARASSAATPLSAPLGELGGDSPLSAPVAERRGHSPQLSACSGSPACDASAVRASIAFVSGAVSAASSRWESA